MSNKKSLKDMTLDEIDDWVEGCSSRTAWWDGYRESQARLRKTQFDRKEVRKLTIQRATIWEVIKLGWKLLSILWVPLLILSASLVLVMYFVINFSYLLTGVVDPVQAPDKLPQVSVVKESGRKVEYYKDMEWMSVVEAQELRKKDNVINFAYIDGKSVKYAKDKSYGFVPKFPWIKVSNPAGFSGATRSGYRMTFKYEQEIFHLNVGQPFTSKQRPDLVYVFDDEGNVWMLPEDSQSMVSVEQALIVTGLAIKPNPELSLTFP